MSNVHCPNLKIGFHIRMQVFCLNEGCILRRCLKEQLYH